MFQICSLDLLILLILIAGKGKCPSKPQWDLFRTIESKDTWVGRDTPGSLKSISWPCEGSPQEWCHMPESTLWMLLEILQVWCHNPFLGECLPVPSHTVDEEPFTKSPIYISDYSLLFSFWSPIRRYWFLPQPLSSWRNCKLAPLPVSVYGKKVKWFHCIFIHLQLIPPPMLTFIRCEDSNVGILTWSPCNTFSIPIFPGALGSVALWTIPFTIMASWC